MVRLGVSIWGQKNENLAASVVSLPCYPLWRTPEGLNLVGSRYFKNAVKEGISNV